MATMRPILPVVLALALAAPASAASAVSITAKLTTSTQAPVVGETWRYTVVVRKDGKPVGARMRLQVLLGQTVVGCWKRGTLRQCVDGSLGDWISFRGKRTGIVRWTAESVGVRLTFQALVEVGERTLRLRAPVRVRPTA
jgi:hypothetical protein